VIRADSRGASGHQPFASVKEFASRLCRLQKAPSPAITLARLFRDANVQFEVTKYAAFFQEMEDETKKLAVIAPTSSSPKP